MSKKSRTKVQGGLPGCITGIVVFVWITGIFLDAWKDYQYAKRSVHWPKAAGTIIHSTVAKGVRDGKTSYSPDIRYSYIVEGRQIQSSRIYIRKKLISFDPAGEAHSYIKQYPLGKSVVVYYLPENPSKAVLKPGANNVHYSDLGVTTLFLLIGFMFALYSVFRLFSVTLKTGVIFGSLFEGRKKRSRKPLSMQNKKSKPMVSYNPTASEGHPMDINLDSEMSKLNQVASSSFVYNEPWKYTWIIKIAGKQYGPFSFDKVVSYFERGKITKDYECYPASGGKVVKIKDIVYNKAA